MKKYFAIAALVGAVITFSGPRANAITLKDLATNHTVITCGAFTFSNFQVGPIAFDPALIVHTGYATDGSDININIIPDPSMPECCLVQYTNGFVIDVLGATGNGTYTADAKFSYDVTGPVSEVSADGVFAGTADPASGGLNIASASFVQTYMPNVGSPKAISEIGLQFSTPPGTFVPFTPKSVNLDPGATFVHVQKDFNQSLTINGAVNGAVYESHVSGYTQDYCVPEPGSMAMLIGMGIGGSLFTFRLRRRR